MNFSTNQVMQLFVIGKEETAKVETVYAPDGETVRGYIVKIKKGDEVIDVTDFISKENILSISEALASSETEQLKRKGLLVKLNEEVNGGNPVVGQDYVITLVYRGFGEEDTYSKVVEARATTGETNATLLQKLAESLLINMDVEYSPLYELYTGSGESLTKITMENYKTITADGFYIVEPMPYWSLGRFAETLMNIDVHTATITVEGMEETAWLKNYKFAPVTGIAAIPNTHRIADLEYFCKGERGTSNALVGWPDTPDYVAKVDAKSATGYDVLTVHHAFVGANASNQKSEKDTIFIAEGGSDSLATALNTIKTGLKA